MKKRFSIRRYLTRNLVLWSLLITVLPPVIIYFDTLHELDELFDASLVQTTKVLNGLISRQTLAANREHLVASLLAKDVDLIIDNQHHPYEKKLYFQVWDNKGLVVKSAQAPDIAFGKLEEGFHKVEHDNHHWLTFAIYSKHDDWWLVVGERHDIRGELALNIVIAHVLPITVFIPLLLLAVNVVLKRGFKPLNNIRGEIAKREYKQLHPISNTDTPTEVEGMVSNLNQLLNRLQTAYEKESHFVSDVAHELRTPLAGLLIHTENLIHDIDEPAVVGNLIEMKRSTLRLSHLVNQLLASARSTQNINSEQWATVNLRHITLKALSHCEDQIEAKQLALSTELADISVQGHENMLSSLVGNIIDNAVRYTPANGKVHIQCQHDDNGIRFTVEDSGTGIPATLYDSVKQRFFRIDPGAAEGSGLGLAIVDNVVEQLNIRWEMSQSQLGGLRHQFIFTAAMTGD